MKENPIIQGAAELPFKKHKRNILEWSIQESVAGL